LIRGLDCRARIRHRMSHCIHAIVSPLAHADAISAVWPELPRLNRANGFATFPVNAALIDARIAPTETPTETDDSDKFMLLTDGFRKLLQFMSSGGQLAYIETDYFGGTGGQGALVCQGGIEVMPPLWRSSGIINKALERIGMPMPLAGDRFSAMGFGDVRDNEDILLLIARQ
jgi:hypothetical protein